MWDGLTVRTRAPNYIYIGQPKNVNAGFTEVFGQGKEGDMLTKTSWPPPPHLLVGYEERYFMG